jgi:subtilisin family serine protease
MWILLASTFDHAIASEANDKTIDAQHSVLVMLHLPAQHFRPDANYGGNYDGNHAGLRRIAEQLAREHGLTVISDWPMPALQITCFVMQVPAGDTPEHVAQLLSQDPRTEWAQPLQQFQSLNADGNSLYRAQPSAAAWHIRELHRITTGQHVNITVIDSGVDDQHPDLLGQIARKENFVDGNSYQAELHGTAVAGIIAAKSITSSGFEGIAPDAHITALRACWQENAENTLCNSFTLGKALNFALLHDTGIINLSLGGPPDRLVQSLVQAALARGITVVAATDPQQQGLSFPASIPGVLAVGSDATTGLPSTVVLAPARDIPAPAPHAAYRFVSGTSFAAAHVSGIAALLLELRPALSPTQIHGMLTPGDMQFAHGIDACVTITRIAGLCACSCAATNAANNAAKAFEHP